MGSRTTKLFRSKKVYAQRRQTSYNLVAAYGGRDWNLSLHISEIDEIQLRLLVAYTVPVLT